MSLVFSKEMAGNAQNQRALQSQYDHVQSRRSAFNAMQANFANMVGNADVANAAARIPQDVYREMEQQTKGIMRADNQVLISDLMPLSKSLNIGKVLNEYRRSSDAGLVNTSLSGQIPANLDKVQYDYDGAIVVIHSTAYGREWRELEGQRSEGFDGLLDDNEAHVRAVRDTVVDHVYDGKDTTFKGVSAYGIKNSSNTELVDLGAGGLNVDFTAAGTSATDMRAGLLQILYTLRTDNNITQSITVYISREIEENWQRIYDSAGGMADKTILQTLSELAGVAAIKTDAHLSDNEMVMGVLDRQYIQLLSGMAMSTVPMIRQNPFDNYNFLVWTAVGLQIKTDFGGRTGWLYAREA
jgi:hypothetical protein